MNKRQATAREGLRIVWAITAKDLLDALKNKTTLGVLLSVLFVLVAYQLLPKWQRGSSLPTVPVAEATRWALSGGVPWSEVSSGLGVTLAWAVTLLAGVAWMVQRLDR